MFLNLNEDMKLVFELKKENEKEIERVEAIRSLTLNLDSPIEPSLVPVGIGNAVDSIGNKISENIYEQIKLSNEVSK